VVVVVVVVIIIIIIIIIHLNVNWLMLSCTFSIFTVEDPDLLT